jgi:hypothetical protein
MEFTSLIQREYLLDELILNTTDRCLKKYNLSYLINSSFGLAVRDKGKIANNLLA